MIKAFTILMMILISASSVCHGQLRDSSKNSVQLGLTYGKDHRVNMALSYERLIFPRTSMALTVGVMPKKSGVLFPKWVTCLLMIEGRYYLKRSSQVPMSGLFVGPYVCYEEAYVWYRESRMKAFRFYHSSVGIGVGYQLNIGNRWRLMWGIRLGRHGRKTVEYWDNEGRLGYRYYWPSGWIGYATIGVGYSF